MKLNPSGTQARGLAAARNAKLAANPRPVKVDSAVAIAPPSTASQATQRRSLSPQPRFVQPLRPIQRAPRPARQLPSAAGEQQQHDPLADWAEAFRRQVRALPQGPAALHNLLRAVDHLLHRAENCGSHSGVMKAYLSLGLVDLTAQAWQQHTEQLQQQQHTVSPEQYKQQQLEAELALAGCRFMRLQSAEQLAKQLHILLDAEGYSPTLDLAALPAPHALGLRVPQLLRKGLGVNLQNPAIRVPSIDGSSYCNLNWEEYSTLSADQSMCGDWQFCYWVGDATWVPAPFGKFSTAELAAVLTPDVVVASLCNGIWGRALVTAAQEQGLHVGAAQPAAVAAAAAAAAQQQLSAVAGAAASVPENVKVLLEESMGSNNFGARVRQFSSAVRSNIVGMPIVPAQGAGVQH